MIDLKPISKQELINKFHEIEGLGWIENTTRKTNDGAAGNKLEDLLGIPENNLPIPNAAEWELKTQRDTTSSLLTLFHSEPSPRALRFVPALLLPQYGWPHQEAGTLYPESEMSFRATLNSTSYTRGFSVVVNDKERKVLIKFDSNQVQDRDAEWLKTVKNRVGNLNDFDIAPYWGFDDLYSKARTKLLNCFFVEFEQKREDGILYFHYYKVHKLQNLHIGKLLEAIRNGIVYIDFDARTGHNHGTKFRINPLMVPELYEIADVVLDKPKLS